MFEYIQNLNLKFTKTLSTRGSTKYIVLHHSGASANQTVEQIHQYHIKHNGWIGIGYNIIVDKDGNAYWGRGLDKVGAQCKGYNNESIGICAIGNFMIQQMPEVQKNMLKRIVSDLKQNYNLNSADVKGHKELGSTDCPGDSYPLAEIKGAITNTTIQTASTDYTIKELQGYIGAVQDNIAGSETLSKCPTIRPNSRGNVVKWLQNKLNNLGYNCGTADSIFGIKTLTGVKKYQQAKGLKADGIVGKKTWTKILGL